MVTTLITVGIVSLLAAIVGGGFKALGVEVPLLRSAIRQFMLALAGAVLLASAYLIHQPDPGNELTLGLEAYDEGKFVDAMPHFAYAAHRGNQEAEYHYGEMLYHGEGCVPNVKEGIRWVRKAAEGGFAPAEASLAMVYYTGGGGIEKDNAQSRVWADRSASQNDPIGLMYVAILETDKAKQYSALQKSANLGYAPAQFSLSMFPFHSPGKAGKLTLSVWLDFNLWARKAAEQGLPSAQVTLAEATFANANRETDDSKKVVYLKESYALVDRALGQQNNLFPLSDEWRARATVLKEEIEALLPLAAQLEVVLSNKSWHPELALPYRHGHE